MNSLASPRPSTSTPLSPIPRSSWADREGCGRTRRGGGGRAGRGRAGDREEQPARRSEPTATPSDQPEALAGKSGFSFGDAFGLLKQAVGRIGMDEDQPSPAGDEANAREEEAAPRPIVEAPTREVQEEEDDIPMPASSAPPPPYSTPSSSTPGIPMRSPRFRRGSRGGGHRPGTAGGIPEIPKIGVVEVDPNFRPRGDMMAPPLPASPAVPPPPVAQTPSSKPPLLGRSHPAHRGRR